MADFGPLPRAHHVPEARPTTMTTAALNDLLLESFVDTLRLVPWLLPIYVVLEYISHREVPSVVRRLKLGGAAGPVAGALLGVIPQCSMSVMVTSLFATGHVSMGTLLATYLATSDEALPILLAEGRQGNVILMVVGAKMAIAVVAGYLVDAVLRPNGEASRATPAACCAGSHTGPLRWTGIVVHGLRHTMVVVAWVFTATFLLGILLEGSGSLDWVGGDAGEGFFRVAAVAAFGLIPNCAASVAITEALLKAGLPFGPAIAGLSAGAGFGPIVLFREVEMRRALSILAMLLAVAIAGGLVIDAFYPMSLPVMR